MPKDTTL